MNRDWSLASAKVDAELDRCRNCGYEWRGRPGVRLERAHVIGCEHDDKQPVRWLKVFGSSTVELWVPGVVAPDRIIPLCGPATDTTTCHGRQHRGELDVLRLLTLEEQVQAVADAGGIQLALERLVPDMNPRRVAR